MMSVNAFQPGTLLKAFLPAGSVLHMWLAGPEIALCFPCQSFCWSVRYHVCHNYIMYIVAMQLYFGQLDGCLEYWCSYHE